MASSSSAAATPVVTPATRRSRFDSTTSTSTNQSVSSVASGGSGAVSSLMMMSASSSNSRVSGAMTSARDDDDDDYAQRIVIRLRSCKPKEHEELVRVHLSHELGLAGPSVEGVLEPPKRSRRERLLSKTRNKLGLVEHSEYTHTTRV